MRNYARAIGTESGLVGPSRAKFPFVDISTGQRWQVDLGGGRLPTWVFDRARRVPDTGLLDYLKLAPILWAGADELVGNTIPCDSMLYRRLVQPLLLAALNCDPPEGAAGLAGAIMRETLLAGGEACRPLVARAGMSAVLVEPAVKLLERRGAIVRLSHRLRNLGKSGGHIRGHPGAERAAARDRDRLQKPVPCWRLDRNRLAATIEGAVRSGHRAADLALSETNT